MKQALKSMKVGKALGPSGVTSALIKAAGATEVNPLNLKARFQSSWPRVISYRYIRVREIT